jgi:hypothetical protein
MIPSGSNVRSTSIRSAGIREEPKRSLIRCHELSFPLRVGQLQEPPNLTTIDLAITGETALVHVSMANRVDTNRSSSIT